MPNGRKMKERGEEKVAPTYRFPLPIDGSSMAQRLIDQKQVHNIGLLFNKFLWIWHDNWTLDAKVKEGKREKSVKSWFLERVQEMAGSFPRNAYYAFLERQVKLAESLRNHVYETIIFGKRADARILSGLGGAHPVEVGFAFHPLYGFPYLPGSGLKGVARAWAELTKQDETKIKLVFGSESKDERQAKEHQQGEVIFLDAYAITPPKLEVDILNPHFPEYYRDPKNNLPTEWQSPNPVNFLTIGVGCEEKDKPIFQFALAARSIAALQLANEWLEHGLEQLGFGGKTASGYGYFAKQQYSQDKLDEIRKGELTRGSSAIISTPKVLASEPKDVKKPTPATTSDKQKVKVAPPKSPKPATKPAVTQGDKLEAKVIANDGRKVTIRLLGQLNQEFTFEHAYYPHRPGKKVKIKVMSVSSDGNVLKVTPA